MSNSCLVSHPPFHTQEQKEIDINIYSLGSHKHLIAVAKEFIPHTHTTHLSVLNKVIHIPINQLTHAIINTVSANLH